MSRYPSYSPRLRRLWQWSRIFHTLGSSPNVCGKHWNTIYLLSDRYPCQRNAARESAWDAFMPSRICFRGPSLRYEHPSTVPAPISPVHQIQTGLLVRLSAYVPWPDYRVVGMSSSDPIKNILGWSMMRFMKLLSDNNLCSSSADLYIVGLSLRPTVASAISNNDSTSE